MGFSVNPGAFEDIREAFDRAVSSPKGIKIPCPNRATATVLRARFNYFRKVHRQQNREIYTAGMKMHNQSVYDSLILRIPPKGAPDDSTLYIEQRSIHSFVVEEIE